MTEPVVDAPMPRASVRTAAIVKPGFWVGQMVRPEILEGRLEHAHAHLGRQQEGQPARPADRFTHERLPVLRTETPQRKSRA